MLVLGSSLSLESMTVSAKWLTTWIQDQCCYWNKTTEIQQVVHSEQYMYYKILHICTIILEETFQLQTPRVPPFQIPVYTTE